MPLPEPPPAGTRMLPPGTYSGEVVLITGGGTGLGRAMAVEFARLGASVAIASRNPEHRGRRGLETEVFERLDLDARQKAEIEKIMKRRRAEAAAAWSEVKPRLNQVVAGTREDLSRVLGPEQLEEYDRLMAERWRRMEGRFGSPGKTEAPKDGR